MSSETTIKTQTVHWDDIWFSVDYTCRKLTMDFKVFQHAGQDISGPNGFYKERPFAKKEAPQDYVYETAEADVFVSGEIKWDGCANIMFEECGKDGYMHFCGLRQFKQMAQLFDRLYQLAAVSIENADKDLMEV